MILPAFILAASLSQQRQRLLPGLLNLPPLLLKPSLLLAQSRFLAAVGDQHQTAVQYLQADAGAHLKSRLGQPLTRNVHLRRGAVTALWTVALFGRIGNGEFKNYDLIKDSPVYIDGVLKNGGF